MDPKKLEKTAAVIEKLAEKKEELENKIETMEKQASKNDKAFEKLVKMAKSKQIDWDEVPEKLAQLTDLEQDEFELELRAMEKAASNEFLNIGSVEEGKSQDVDPLTDFIVDNMY